MADKAHILTDKELEKMERHLSAIYARAEKELAEKAEQYFKRFEELDAKKRQLVEAGKLTEAEYKRWRQNKIMTGRHWTAMKEQAAQELLQANRTAQEYINGRLPSVYTTNYNLTSEGVSAAVSGYSFELVDASTVKNLATSDKTLLPYKYVDGKKDVRWNTQKVNSEVLQGIVQGESIPNIAKRLQNVTEMNRASAIRNARTTVTSAENKGRMDSLHRAAEKGVITHKIWMAAIDARTREAHAELDGQEQGIDDPFESELGDIMYPGDPDAAPANVYNCRCTLTYKVVGFGNKKEEVVDAPQYSEEERAEFSERRRQRMAERRSKEGVQFDTAPVSEVKKYATEKLKTNFDFKGASESAIRGAVKAADRFERAGGTLGDAKVVFGGTKGMYGFYDPKTKTIHLRANDSFVEKMLEENTRSMFKLGRPRWADASYEGMAAHEFGHAFDRYFNQEIAREISQKNLLSQAFSISSYAATEAAYGSPRASEAVAENISAYLAGGEEREKISPEIIEILEKYFGRRK